MTTQVEAQIANDLNACDTALVFLKGGARRRFVQHRKACFAEIKAMNERDGLGSMSDDELLAELFA